MKTSWTTQEYVSTFTNLTNMARFQQKQLQEKEQKLLQLYDQQQQRAYQIAQRNSAGSNSSNLESTIKNPRTIHSTSQGGKVRQMFDERRQVSVKGIDKSYPLKPLENKLRKNGNSTINQQSVTLKRIACADVNSNVNNSKPIISYHEEITRNSFGPPIHRHNSEDEYVTDNRVGVFTNGHHRYNVENEQANVLDQDEIEKNRMMAKIHLMGFDESLRHRIRNDLESEEFPEDYLFNVPDKLPKKNITKKLSQAITRLEKFQNINAKKSNIPKQSILTNSTVIKKRSEQMGSTGLNSRRNETFGTNRRNGIDRTLKHDQEFSKNAKSSLLNQIHTVDQHYITNKINKMGKESSDTNTTIITDKKLNQLILSGVLISIGSKLPQNKGILTEQSVNPQFSNTILKYKHCLNPQFFCKESEKSVTTSLIKAKKNSTYSPKGTLKKHHYTSNIAYERPIKFLPPTDTKYSMESKYNPNTVITKYAIGTNIKGDKTVAIKTHRSPNILIIPAVLTNSIVNLKYGLEFDDLFEPRGPICKFMKSPNQKQGRQLPLIQDLKNIKTYNIRDYQLNNQYKVIQRPKKLKLSFIESEEKGIPKSTYKNTSTKADIKTQRINMTDHQIERNKLQKILKPILNDRIGKLYTKPFNARTRYALPINDSTEKKYCQKISNLETNMSRPKKNFFQKEFKSRQNDRDIEKPIGLGNLNCNFANKTPSYITTRANKDIYKNNKTKIFGTRKERWKQSLENQVKCTMTPFKECKDQTNTNFHLTQKENCSIKNKDASFKTFDFHRRIERETEDIADNKRNQERIQNKKTDKINIAINKKYPLAVKITSSGTIQDRLNKSDKIKKNPEETALLSMKTLTSIQDIRKSINNERGKLIAPKRSKSTIAYRHSTSRKDINSTIKPIIVVNPTRNIQILSRNNAAKLNKVKSCISRISNSSNSDPSTRKQHETNMRETRGSVSLSPSKSSESALKCALKEPKNPQIKTSKKLAKNTEPIANKTMIKSLEATDDIILQNSPQQKPSHQVTASVSGRLPSSMSSTFLQTGPIQTQILDRKGKMTSRGKTSTPNESQKKGSFLTKNTRSTNSVDNLVACKMCGRSFAEDRISLHEQICEKTTNKKRKQFDIITFRVKGTDLEPFVKNNIVKKPELKAKKPEIKSNWRRKHEDFINTIRSAKQMQVHLAAGGKLSDLSPPPPSDTSDYIQCPHCGRKFNQAAAERHIPKCEHMLHNKPRASRAKR